MTTATQTANAIMDEACLGEPYVSNGVDAALRKAIAEAIENGASARADQARVNQAPTGPGPSGFDPSRKAEQDQIIEAMARALCIAHGFDPDYVASHRCIGLAGVNKNGEPNERIEPNDEPTWKSWVRQANAQYRAYLAMQTAIKEQVAAA